MGRTDNVKAEWVLPIIKPYYYPEIDKNNLVINKRSIIHYRDDEPRTIYKAEGLAALRFYG